MFRFILYVLFCFVAAQPLSAENPWPMFRHDLQHTGRTDYAGPSTPVVNWVFHTSECIMSSPTIAADGTIYFGTNPPAANNSSLIPAHFYAIRPDGTAKWSFQTGGGIFSSAALTENGLILFGSLDDTLYAVRDRGGAAEIQWDFPAGLRRWSSDIRFTPDVQSNLADLSRFYPSLAQVLGQPG